MTATRKLVSIAALAALGALTAGCGSVSDLGSPFTGAKQALLGKPQPTPDLPDRPKLAMPAPNAPLPVPGQAAPAQTQLAAPAQPPNQQAVAAAPKSSESSGWLSGLFGSDDKKTQ